jgi:thiamine-monophosphate kinase
LKINPLRTPIEQLGIRPDSHTKSFEIVNTGTVKAIGDDAVVKFENHTVVTTDMLVEGIHFDLSYVPLKHLGQSDWSICQMFMP